MSALAITPADVDWFLSLFPDGNDTLNVLKAKGKIIIIDEQAKKNANRN